MLKYQRCEMNSADILQAARGMSFRGLQQESRGH